MVEAGQQYIRKRDKTRCFVAHMIGELIYLRYADEARARRAGDWFVSAEQLGRLYRLVTEKEHEQ
jgi:hypothetical protein